MHRVKTIDTSVFIAKKDLEKCLKRVKTCMPNDLAIIYASSLDDALNICDWKVKKDKDGNIIDLRYCSSFWRTDSENIINFISCYLKKGSYIKISDERYDVHWRLDFNGGFYPAKSTLKYELVDFKSEQDLVSMLEKVSLLLLSKGYSTEKIYKIIDKQCASLVLETLT